MNQNGIVLFFLRLRPALLLLVGNVGCAFVRA